MVLSLPRCVHVQDRATITCTAPGLYEVTFGFYTRRKPTVQLLVNGARLRPPFLASHL